MVEDIKITPLRNVMPCSLVNKHSCSRVNFLPVYSEFPEDVWSIFFPLKR